MDKKFEIIRQDGEYLIFLADTGISLRVITPAQRAARKAGETGIFEIGNAISAVINDLALPDALFPVTVVYDFLIVDNKVIKTTSAINEIKSAIEYYCISKLKAGVGQIQISDLETLGAGIAASMASE